MKNITNNELLELNYEADKCWTECVKNRVKKDIFNAVENYKNLSIMQFRNDLQLLLAERSWMDTIDWITKFWAKFAVEFIKNAHIKEIEKALYANLK